MAIEKLKYYEDYLFNYQSLNKINEIIDNLGAGYDQEGVFTSLENQTGAPQDTPKIISYGAVDELSENGHVFYDAIERNLTVNTTGFYSLKVRLRFSRSGQNGTSRLFNWAEISTDGGATYNILGTAIDLSIDGPTDNRLFFDSTQILLPAGIKLRSVFARSSTGSNSGDLAVSTPSAALQAYGLQVSPSAQLVVYKI